MKLLGLVLLLSCVASPAVSGRAKTQSTSPISGLLDVKGGSIYYEAQGKGPPVVFVHGGFGDRRMWDDQFQALAKYFLVVRYDHRGFGRSSVPQGPYSPVDDLLRLLDKLNIERAHLVGNSMGGSLVLDFALKHPDRVSSLVVVASGPNGYPVPQKDIDSVLSVFKAAEEAGLEKAADLWLEHQMVAVTSRKPEVRERLRTMVVENRRIFEMKEWPSETMEPPAAKRLKEIGAPTLVIIGGKDTELSRAMGEAAARGITGAKKIVMEEADHLPQMANASKFNKYVMKFLRSL
jgi:3-oxoadipate enol-lactonase